MNRPLVLSLIVTASLLVLTPAAIASPRPDHTHRHHDSSDWAGSGDGRGDLHRRDAVWSFYDSRDNDDSDSSDDSSGDSSDDSSDDSDSDSSDDATTGTGGVAVAPVTGTQAVAGGVVKTGAQQTITAELTGFSWADNSPPGSSTVCCGVLHEQAGGTGTFADPITTAVPGSSGQGMETASGTRIYVAKLRRYFIVEDSGATKMSAKHFDLWVGGQGLPKSASDKCMNSYTGRLPVIINPAAGLPVTIGPLTGPNGCKI